MNVIEIDGIKYQVDFMRNSENQRMKTSTGHFVAALVELTAETIQCKLESCDVHFVPDRKGQVYCSKDCVREFVHDRNRVKSSHSSYISAPFFKKGVLS
jgi:hypothetical protein